jgi:hypothetical protein
VILHKPYNYKCDVYSYGVLLWETLHREVPFAEFAPLQAAFAVAMEGKRPAIALQSEFAQYEQLIVACWDADPNVRPGMDVVVARTAELHTALEATAAAAAAAAGRALPSPSRSLFGLPEALASRLSLSARRHTNERMNEG